MKPDYVVGHKFVWKGSGIKEFEAYKEGDIFEIVPPKKRATLVGNEDGAEEKYVKAPDGKVFRFKGGAGFKNTAFTHYKEGGGTPSGAEWEDLIVYAYNQLNKEETDPETVKVAMKFWSLYEKQSYDVARSLKRSLKARKLVQTGRGMGKIELGPHWKKAGAKNKTPKTDIASHDFKERISLKKAGGSQLISAAREEAIAIVNAALSDMGSDKKFANDLIKAMEEGMTKLISNETITALQRKSKAGEKSDAVIDFEKKDRNHKELSSLLETYINQDNEANALFSKFIVLEASTGNHKFGSPNSRAAANLLAKFEPGKGKVEVAKIDSIKSPLIIQYASKAKPYVSFKKGGGNSPAYSAFRMGLSEEKFQTLDEIILEEMSQDFSYLLTEEVLTEGPMQWLNKARTSAKKLGGKMAKKFNAMLKSVWAKVTKAFNKIRQMGSKMFAALMQFFGVQIDKVRGIPGEVNL